MKGVSQIPLGQKKEWWDILEDMTVNLDPKKCEEFD